MRSAAIGVRADVNPIRWLFERLSWFDAAADAAKTRKVDAAVQHANTSARAADDAIAEKHNRQDDLRGSFRRADGRLARR